MAVGIGVMVTVALISLFSAYLFLRQMRLWYIFRKFHGPKAYPLIGTSYLFDRDPRAFFKMMRRVGQEVAWKHPDDHTRIRWIGPVPLITTTDTKDIETILGSSKQIEKGLLYRFFVPWLGNGLLLNKGKGWQGRRKLLTPSFHFSVLNSFVDIFNEKAKILVEKMEGMTGRDPVNVFQLVTNCTLDVICATAMGINIGAQEGDNTEYVKAVVGISDIVTRRMRYPWLWVDAIFNLLPEGKKHKQYLEILHGMTLSVIKERLQEKRQRKQNGVVNSGDVISDNKVNRTRKMAFLDLLLELHEEDETFTIDDVREEVDTFMFEGHDTTAAAISWALFMIGHHPKVQDRIHKELEDVLGDDPDRNLTTDDIQNLKYLGYVIKETLRLYPSVPIIGRQLEQDTTLFGKYVPKGTLVVIHIYFLHRSPLHFPDPEQFNPDNFLPENVEGRDPFAYIPFSAGPRNCIGQKFALMEEKVILATILRKLKFRSLQTTEEVCETGNLILRPYDGISMEISRRQEYSSVCK